MKAEGSGWGSVFKAGVHGFLKNHNYLRYFVISNSGNIGKRHKKHWKNASFTSCTFFLAKNAIGSLKF